MKKYLKRLLVVLLMTLLFVACFVLFAPLLAIVLALYLLENPISVLKDGRLLEDDESIACDFANWSVEHLVVIPERKIRSILC